MLSGRAAVSNTAVTGSNPVVITNNKKKIKRP